MPLSQPNTVFGIHSVTPYDLVTKEPLGIFKVLGSAQFNLEGEVIPLQGGSSPYNWDVEDGNVTSEISITIREFPSALYEAFLGRALTSNSAEALAAISSAIVNANGTSVVAATGLASVGVKSGSEVDVKTGKYVVKAVSATTVDVFSYSDVDFGKGADKTFEDDLLKITATPLTIVQASSVDVPGFGIELTGDSGTIAMVTDDTAIFDTRAQNTGSESIVIGSITDRFTTVGLYMVGQRKGTGELFAIDVYRAKGVGVPFPFSEKEWMESEITLMSFYDADRDGVFSIERVKVTG
ncbi:MAG: hypothetical protein ACUZ8E_17925 [Candidatus Anammoxibacter sp.]